MTLMVTKSSMVELFVVSNTRLNSVINEGQTSLAYAGMMNYISSNTP